MTRNAPARIHRRAFTTPYARLSFWRAGAFHLLFNRFGFCFQVRSRLAEILASA